MAFIGNTNTTQAFTPAIDYFSGTGSATAFTLSRPVASVAQVQVTIDNVAQNPSSAYTVSGNTITFTSAPLSGTNNIYVYYTSPITQVIAPGQGTVNLTSLAGQQLAPIAVSDQVNTSTGYLAFPSGTTAQRPGTPVTGSARYNSTTAATELYQSGYWQSIAGNYSVEYLAVAGGGGGGFDVGGGGGAGGVAYGSLTVFGSTPNAVTVGSGGAGAITSSGTGGSGTNSSFASGTIAIGGGGAGSWQGVSGLSGGSGGGGGGSNAVSAGSGGSGTTGQGFAGANGTKNGFSGSNGIGGGGGGAGAVGSSQNGGNGTSTYSAWGAATSTGQNVSGTYYYAGGGATSDDVGGSAGTAGYGGGGLTSVAGTANTGGGGGGNGATGLNGGNGGSGIVIVRYAGTQKGTGGTVVTTGGYTYHTFTSSGTYTA